MNPISRLLSERIFSVVRLSDAVKAEETIKALHAGGINIIELVLENPSQVKLIEKITKETSNPVIMAGGIITERQADIAIKSGAAVIVSPVFQMNLVRLCKSRSTPLIVTTTTPNEAYSAWKAGTGLIKISPANPMGGAEYIEDLLRPMKFLNVIAAGSIKVNEIDAYLRAGAKAVGIGRDLYSDASTSQIEKRAAYAVETAQQSI